MNELVLITKNKVTTNSLIIAKEFNKKHKNILIIIKNLNCSEKFNGLNFKPVKYKDLKGEKRPMYEITRDGWLFLVTGFTGKKAGKIKEKFIDAFNRMELALLRLNSQDWKQARIEGKITRGNLTDVIEQFIEYASDRGSTNAKMYFANFSMLANRNLFYCPTLKKINKNMRDTLSSQQLIKLTAIEMIIYNVLKKEMAIGIEYKEIYKYIKSKVEEFSSLIGKSLPVGLNNEQINLVMEKKYTKLLKEEEGSVKSLIANEKLL